MDLLDSDRHKLVKLIKRECAQAYHLILGRKYLLPSSRQADYANMEFENFLAFDRLCTFASNIDDENDEVWRITLGNTVLALNYGRPTLYLERELGEALMRTQLLRGLKTDDIKWRWPAFRIVLPLGLITIARENGLLSLTHVDMGRIHGPEAPFRCPKKIAAEVDSFVVRHVDASTGSLLGMRLSLCDFRYKHEGMIISSATDRPEHGQTVRGQPSFQTLYASLKPLGEEIDIGDYCDIEHDLDSPFQQDASDRAMLSRLEHLCLNILLFLSGDPEYYQPDWGVVRKASPPTSRELKPELVRARFVGEMQRRPLILERKPSRPTGRHLIAHWRSGSWRRQHYGPKWSQTKTIWVQPYCVGKTHEE
jgi:hypothetical protein